MPRKGQTEDGAVPHPTPYFPLNNPSNWPLGPLRKGAAEAVLPAHEFRYSRLENLDPDVRFAYQVLRGHGIDGQHDGLAHLRHVEGKRRADRFIDLMRRYRQAQPPAPPPATACCIAKEFMTS